MSNENILIDCVKKISYLMKENICSNVSFHSQNDFVEISENRDDKFPAIIMRGPLLEEDKQFRTLDDIILKNIELSSYSKENAPKVYDIYFKIIIISEGDMEGLETIINATSFFHKYVNIDSNGKVYNVSLTKDFEESRTSNLSDLNRYEGTFCIEGIEIGSGSIINGKLVKELNLTINQ